MLSRSTGFCVKQSLCRQAMIVPLGLIDWTTTGKLSFTEMGLPMRCWLIVFGSYLKEISMR